MTDDQTLALRDLLTDTEALQTSMLLTINGTTADHSKWVTFKSVAREYNDVASRYAQATGEQTMATM